MLRDKRTLLFFVVFTLFNMAASFVHPITPTLFKDLALPDYMFGVALAAMMSANFLFSPFWGRLNSYISSRLTLLICCLGYALGQYFFATAQTSAQFIAARVVAGIFTGGVFVSALNYLVNTAPDPRARGLLLTTSATIQTVASSFGFFVGGMLGAIHISYALVAQVLTLALCGLLFLPVCAPDAQFPLAELKASVLLKQANPFKAFTDGRKALSPALMMMLALAMLQNLGLTAFDQSFNYYLKDQFGYSPAYNGALKAAMGIVTLLFNATLCVRLMRRPNKARSLGLLFLGSGAIMVLSINLGQIWAFLAVNVLFYALCSICLPLLQDVAAEMAQDRDSNLVMGLFNGLRSLGGIVGALAAGGLYALSPGYPFVCTAIAFFVAFLITALSRK